MTSTTFVSSLLSVRGAKPFVHTLTCGLAAVLGLAAAVPAHAAPIMIDDFNTMQSVFATSGAPMATSSASAPEALGGERDIKVQFLSGSTVISLSTNPFGAGLMIHDSGASVKGTSLTVWDGNDGNGNIIDYDGLGGVNLLAGGLNAFKMTDVFADLTGHIRMTVFDASDATGNTWSQSTFNLPGGLFTASDILLNYADFTTLGPAGAANFANVGAISLEISNTTTGSLDVQMSSIQAVPEPTTGLLAVLGLGLVGLRARRGRK